MKFVIQRGEGAPSCFPEGFDTSGLKDITTLTDTWRKYIDREGKVIDCATFWAQCLIGGLSITHPPKDPS